MIDQNMKSVIQGPKMGFENVSLKQSKVDVLNMNINIQGSKLTNIIRKQAKFAQKNKNY